MFIVDYCLTFWQNLKFISSDLVLVSCINLFIFTGLLLSKQESQYGLNMFDKHFVNQVLICYIFKWCFICDDIIICCFHWCYFYHICSFFLTSASNWDRVLKFKSRRRRASSVWTHLRSGLDFGSGWLCCKSYRIIWSCLWCAHNSLVCYFYHFWFASCLN